MNVPLKLARSSNKEKQIWVIREKKTKAKGNIRKKPSVVQRKNENRKKKRRNNRCRASLAVFRQRVYLRKIVPHRASVPLSIRVTPSAEPSAITGVALEHHYLANNIKTII